MTRRKFIDELHSLPTTNRLCASGQRPLKMGDIRRRQRKLGELCWSATVSRPAICARFAQFVFKVNDRIDDLIESAKEWHQATVLTYQSGPHVGTLTPAGWLDPAYGDHPKKGRCRLGSLVSTLPSPLRSPRRVLRRSSKFTRKTVKSSRGGEGFTCTTWNYCGMFMVHWWMFRRA